MGICMELMSALWFFQTANSARFSGAPPPLSGAIPTCVFAVVTLVLFVVVTLLIMDGNRPARPVRRIVVLQRVYRMMSLVKETVIVLAAHGVECACLMLAKVIEACITYMGFALPSP